MENKFNILLACLISMILLLVGVVASSNPLDIYKNNYLIIGNEESQIKGQFSAKYNLFSTKEAKEFYPFAGLLFFGYTHTFHFANYEKSKPVDMTHYNPELFIKSSHKTKYIQIGLVEHKSNGEDGSDSRGFNRSYIQGNYEFNPSRKFNFGTSLKLFWLYAVSGGNSENKKFDKEDISEYIGFTETKLYYYYMNSSNIEIFRVYVSGALGASKTFRYRKHNRFGFVKRGWLESGAMIRLPKSNLFLYGQMFYGYGEWIVNYNKKSTSFRLGVLYKG